MESKLLNKIVLSIAFFLSISVFSQMKMTDVDGNKFSVNLKTEKSDLIKIFNDSNYIIYYILDRRDFNLKKGLGFSGTADVIFFSKKYNKGLLATFKQSIYHEKKSIYNITLHTGSYDKNMFVSSMAVLGKDFNYEFFMKYYYMPPPKGGDYKSWITIQDTKNYCNVTNVDIKGNAINENIDDILSNISSVPKNNTSKKCDPIIYDIDLRDFFSKKIVK